MSTEREWTFRIEHILEAIAKIQRYTRDLNEAEFMVDSLRVDAVIRNFQVIGEAARHVPREIQDHYPEIPWSLMQGMRHILVHNYDDVKVDIVWKTVQEKLTPLIEPLRKVLAENSL